MLPTPTFLCESESKETGWPKPYKCPLTSHDFGLAVNKLWLPVREVPLAGVVENLEEGAFFWSCAGYPLVKCIFKQQIKFCGILEQTGKLVLISICKNCCFQLTPDKRLIKADIPFKLWSESQGLSLLAPRWMERKFPFLCLSSKPHILAYL